MTQKEIERVILDFWWERYRSAHRPLNRRTRDEIEELAKRIAKAEEEDEDYEPL